IERRAGLTAILVDAAELWQGVADAAFAARGRDDVSPADDALAALARAVAAALLGRDGNLGPALERGRAAPLPTAVAVHDAEGFAPDAVYPEAYAAAARALERAPTVVVGVRSIGTALAPVVAAALGAALLVTVRPVGDPLARRLAV